MDGGAPPRHPIRRWRRAYSTAARWLLHALIAFSLANALLWGLLRARATERVANGAASLARAVALEYEPFTSFRPRAASGRWLNVSPDGYRRVRLQGPWPPAPDACSVFVFGGSTAFGAGVPDHGAIPSRLGDRLSSGRERPVHVYNFGRPGYVVTQERLLLERLLSSGVTPRLAVFVDGPDEFRVWPRPLTADIMRRALEAGRDRSTWSDVAGWLDGLPVGRAARALGGGLRPRPVSAGGPPEAARALREWLANKRLIEELMDEFDARALFVWQEDSWQGHDLALDPPGAAAPRPARRSAAGDALLRRWRRDGEGDASSLWLGDLEPPSREAPSATAAREASAFAEVVSRRIAEHVLTSDLLECSRPPR